MADHVVSSPSPTTILWTRTAALRAVQGVEMNPFSRALEQLKDAAEETGVPIAVVGGLAAIRYGAPVATVDIDIVVPIDGRDMFLAAAERRGVMLKTHAADGWHRLEFRDGGEAISIEVVPEGGRTPRDPPDAPAVPHPAALGVSAGLNYASLEGWVGMKLVAGRDKDRYHLTEVFKVTTTEQIAACVQAVRPLPARYLHELHRLVRAAEDEKSHG